MYLVIIGLAVLLLLACIISLFFIRYNLNKHDFSSNNKTYNNSRPKVYKIKFLSRDNETINIWFFDHHKDFFDDVRNQNINIIMIQTELFKVSYKSNKSVILTPLNNQVYIPANTILHVIGWSV